MTARETSWLSSAIPNDWNVLEIGVPGRRLRRRRPRFQQAGRGRRVGARRRFGPPAVDGEPSRRPQGGGGGLGPPTLISLAPAARTSTPLSPATRARSQSARTVAAKD